MRQISLTEALRSGLPPDLRSRVSCRAGFGKGCLAIHISLDGPAASNLELRCAKHELQPLLPFLRGWVLARLTRNARNAGPLHMPAVELQRDWKSPAEKPPGAMLQHLLSSSRLATEAAWRANQTQGVL